MACAGAITALAWAYLLHLHHGMTMPGPLDTAVARPWTAHDAAIAFAMWVVMMAGMMAAPATPALLLFAGMRKAKGAVRQRLDVSAFALGYFLDWIAFGAAATLLQWALHEATVLDASMAAATRPAAGAILTIAGVYQFLPLKTACLAHCRSPLGVFMTRWREGVLGAVSMGLRHGAYCIGCCWALMGILFAVGVMNLVWVALLTVLVLYEKAGPAGSVVARGAGVAMVAAGLAMLAGAA